MLVKTAHKDFPRELLAESRLERGEWTNLTSEKDDVKLQACRFRDLKIKDFISTCDTVLPGEPRKTKHHGGSKSTKTSRIVPKKNAASIDIHNHVRAGSQGLEDSWKTP